MPSPRAGESRDDFLDRCIPEVVAEGRDPDQAVAMCLAYYEGEKDKAFNIDKMGEVEYWKAFNNKRDSLEDRYTRSILKAFREQTSFIDDATTIQDLRGRIDPEPMVKAIEELYQDVGDSFARSTFSGMKKMVAPSFKQQEDFIERMLRYVDYETIQKITDFSSELIQKAIIKGLEEGLDIRQIARQLREQGMSSARARTIARTEIATASNGGSFEGALQSNVPFKKRWVAFNDGVTRGSDPRDRFNHLSQTINDVDKNEPFIVSGEQMMFPTDRKLGASVGNIVNCRCVSVFLTE